ncbi:MAG: helix-turn-helix domain-containing protein [Oscillospiraceae bacterium]|nr:helix-turn-helix domain-containing protein [Oscillospiraceae bacterium]
MELSIGKNIRRLRGDAGLTQEELAQALSISPQSVSKWERGDGYPDITALPGLARFFGVTLDELMGMDDFDDWNFFSHINNLWRAGEYDEAERLVRSMSKAFPNRMRGALATTLMLAGRGAQEAIALFEQEFANAPGEKYRSYLRASLCLLYATGGQHEKALALARTLPHFWESREFLLTQFLPEDERPAHTRMAILKALQLLCRKIEGGGWENVINGGMGICDPEDVDWRAMLGKIAGYLSL